LGYHPDIWRFGYHRLIDVFELYFVQ